MRRGRTHVHAWAGQGCQRYMHGRGRGARKNARLERLQVSRNVAVPILVVLPVYTMLISTGSHLS